MTSKTSGIPLTTGNLATHIEGDAARNKRGKGTPSHPEPVTNPGPFTPQVNTDTDPDHRADRIVSAIDGYANHGKVTYPRPNWG
ncbi:unnamed protein product, partial [Clonostachys solani]